MSAKTDINYEDVSCLFLSLRQQQMDKLHIAQISLTQSLPPTGKVWFFTGNLRALSSTCNQLNWAQAHSINCDVWGPGCWIWYAECSASWAPALQLVTRACSTLIQCHIIPFAGRTQLRILSWAKTEIGFLQLSVAYMTSTWHTRLPILVFSSLKTQDTNYATLDCR